MRAETMTATAPGKMPTAPTARLHTRRDHQDPLEASPAVIRARNGAASPVQRVPPPAGVKAPPDLIVVLNESKGTPRGLRTAGRQGAGTQAKAPVGCQPPRACSHVSCYMAGDGRTPPLVMHFR